jgi:predicted CXXCH cytochrome family protein
MKFLWMLVLGAWCFPTLGADSILNSKHDLSASGPGAIRAATETEVCMFCHTPHRGTGDLPLWNHTLSTTTYKLYESSTTKATIGQPTGASKLCLSCHDGTVALGKLSSRANTIQMRNGVTVMPAGASNLGTDLSDDHPISFTYDNALVSANGQLKDPSTLTDKVKLDHNNQLQCTSCHDPHNNQYGKFLVEDNRGSALCVACHNLTYWQDSSHHNSTKTWNANGSNPWPHTTYTTVTDNACENCHAPHTAGAAVRLLNYSDEEKNCFTCHSGNVAAKNIQAEFNKFSTHPILNTTGVHDPTEDPVNSARHVECADCHNPHATKSTSASAPNATGALTGVKGVSASGATVSAVSYEYELCYRCHADSINRGTAKVDRQYVQTNTRLEFQPSNSSFHPIETVGRNSSVPSLIAPLTTGSRMYCTDCHNNDQGPNAGGSGPNGPHGSTYSPLLERQLLLTDNNTESIANYALCYKCHSRDSVLADDSFKGVNALNQDRGHRYHIVDQKTACTTCHDSHGVATVPHLINFNTSTGYVTASSNGRIEYLSTGNGSGNCSLTCHGFDHNATPYPILTGSRSRRR